MTTVQKTTTTVTKADADKLDKEEQAKADLLTGTTPTVEDQVIIPGTVLETFNGKPISVGDTVALVCTVVALNPLDAHYGEVQCSPLYPGLGILHIPNVQSGQVPQSRDFPDVIPEGSPLFGFHPKQLVEYVPPTIPEKAVNQPNQTKEHK